MAFRPARRPWMIYLFLINSAVILGVRKGFGARMAKYLHEFRDPLHAFIRVDTDERKVVDSPPVQRLRSVHQLAMSYLVYPGATHKRFEHTLGVMDLAGRVFDTIIQNDRVSDEIRDSLPELTNREALAYWRRVLRTAALCHDVGHLPFSHAAEKELFPPGWDHERMTQEIILTNEMRSIWNSMSPPPRPEDIVKLALGPRKTRGLKFTIWETVLSEIIVGDAFGVDRMDFLLRDAYHTGVVYGRFDHYRLIDTLRLLPSPHTSEPALGLEFGGTQAAEGLLLARYFMYSQVYFHPVRRIYDIELCKFLKAYLRAGYFSTRVEDHLLRTDNEISTSLFEAARDPRKRGHAPARRIIQRDHFKVFYQRDPRDVRKNPEAVQAISRAAKAKFGAENVEVDTGSQRGGAVDFPVLMKSGAIRSSLEVSEILNEIPVAAHGYIYIIPEKRQEAMRWLESKKEAILSSNKGER